MMNTASRFRLRQGSQPSGFGVTAGNLGGFMPASGGFTGDGVFASGLVEPDALQGTAQSQLSSLAGLDGAPQFTPFVPPATAPSAPVAPVAGGGGYGGGEGDNTASPGHSADMSPSDAIGAGHGPESGGWGSPDGSAGAHGGQSDGAGEGWMVGGYTGHGHPAEPAGTVHKGEVVIPAEMVARYGLRPLMALVEGQVPPSRLAALAGR